MPLLYYKRNKFQITSSNASLGVGNEIRSLHNEFEPTVSLPGELTDDAHLLPMTGNCQLPRDSEWHQQKGMGTAGWALWPSREYLVTYRSS